MSSMPWRLALYGAGAGCCSEDESCNLLLMGLPPSPACLADLLAQAALGDPTATGSKSSPW